MTPRMHKEMLVWVIAATLVFAVVLARECVGGELPPYPEGFEIETEHGDVVACFYHEEEQVLSTAYATAHYCQRDKKTLRALVLEKQVENDFLNDKLRVAQDKAAEHELHAEAVEHLLKESAQDTRRAKMISALKTVGLAVLGVATVALGGALIWEKIDE